MMIYCCQTDIVWENKPANFAKVRSLLAAAAPAPDSLVLLPEMFATGFSMNVTGIREGNPPETAAFLAQTAKELGVFLLGGVVTTTPDGRGRNQSVVFTPQGKENARYTKMQPFNLGGEGQHYTAGTEIITFDWQGFTVAPFVCYDLRFPELFRQAARHGAQLYAVIANWPVTRIQHWITLLQARAIENQAYVAGVNRCGSDPRYTYTGASLIINPRGEIIADAGTHEGVIHAEVELAKLLDYRAEVPFLKDMRSSP